MTIRMIVVRNWEEIDKKLFSSGITKFVTRRFFSSQSQGIYISSTVKINV